MMFSIEVHCQSFIPKVMGHYKMLEFADRRNGFSGSDSAVFDVGSTGFWTIDFFF